MPLRPRTLALAAPVVAALVPLSVAAAPGSDLDPSFGDGGKIVLEQARGTSKVALALQSDGKLVLITSGSGRARLIRLLPDGSLDASFGEGGVAGTPFGNAFNGRPLAIDGSGRILVGGAPSSNLAMIGAQAFVVTRHRPNGSLDGSFGERGTARTDLSLDEHVSSIFVQRDGKVVAVGQQGPVESRLMLARYLDDGGLDPTFGNAGVTLSVEASAPSAARGRDGKIVVAGLLVGPDGRAHQAVIARFTAAGTLDRSFDGDGVVVTPLPDGWGLPRAVAIQRDRKIVVASDGAGSLVVTRRRANGSLDRSFGSAGSIRVDGLYSPRAMTLDARDRIVIAGGGPDVFEGFAVARLTPSGRLDTRFGRNGVATTALGAGGEATAVAIEKDGAIVVAGWQSQTERRLGAPDATLAVARHKPTTCRVPRLTGRTLRAAAGALRRSGCVLGATTRRRGARARGTVVAQRPAGGAVVPDHVRVSVVVAR